VYQTQDIATASGTEHLESLGLGQISLMQGRGQAHCRQKGKGIRGQVCPRPATLCPHFSQAFGSERSWGPAAAFSAPFVLSVPQRVRLRATGTSGQQAALRTVCRRCVGPPVGPSRVHSLHSASAVRSLVRNAGWPGALFLHWAAMPMYRWPRFIPACAAARTPHACPCVPGAWPAETAVGVRFAAQA